MLNLGFNGDNPQPLLNWEADGYLWTASCGKTGQRFSGKFTLAESIRITLRFTSGHGFITPREFSKVAQAVLDKRKLFSSDLETKMV